MQYTPVVPWILYGIHVPGKSLWPFFGMFQWLFQRLSDLQLGAKKVTAWITWSSREGNKTIVFRPGLWSHQTAAQRRCGSKPDTWVKPDSGKVFCVVLVTPKPNGLGFDVFFLWYTNEFHPLNVYSGKNKYESTDRAKNISKSSALHQPNTYWCCKNDSVFNLKPINIWESEPTDSNHRDEKSVL